MKALTNAAGFIKVVTSISKYSNIGKLIDQAKAEGDKETEMRLIYEVTSEWSKKLMGDYYKESLNIINPENLPENGPVVYIANHQSYLDILVFMAMVKHQTGFIAKEELRKAPAVGKWVDRIRGLFIKRGDARESLKTINEGAELIKEGYSMVIFPEGTRSHGHEMGDFKPGALKLATKAKVPVVPVTIDGSYRCFEENGVFTKGQTINVIVHKPIETEGLSRFELAEIPAKAEAMIREGLKQFD